MRLLVALLAVLMIAGHAEAQGLTAKTSNADAAATLARLKTAVEKRGFTIIATVDHAAAAKNAGLELRPTVLMIFGNPKGGTPLMQCNQALGIELPLKILVWQDEGGKTQVGYTAPKDLLARHNAAACTPEAVANMEKGLAAITAEAAGQ